MESNSAIVLAGGLGTRLRGIIHDLPKPMAPIAGKPFLHFLFKYLQKQKIARVILSVGYKYESIKDFFGKEYLGIKIEYSVEEMLLGTGGGIKKAFTLVDDFAFVLNGDSFFDVDLDSMKYEYFEKNADIVIALKHLQNFDRYGTVKLNANERVTDFAEKKFMTDGLINGGVYFFHKALFEKIDATGKFSFEKEVLEKQVGQMKFTAKIFDGYFIDIGVPSDYEKACHDFK